MTDTHDIPQEETRQQEKDALQESRQALLTDIGQRLRQAREQRKLGADEIARELKLRASYLRAMENGDWSTLPGDVYGVGFARQYARFLGVDLEQDIARVSSDEYQLTKPLTFPDPPIAPAKRWAVTATLLFILLFIGFNVFHSVVHKHGQDAGPASLHPASPPPVAKPEAKPAAPAASPTAAATTPAPAAPAKPEPKPAAPAASTTVTAATQAPTAPAPANAEAMPATGEKRKGAHRYRFVAVGGDVWLQLYSSPGNLLKEALLRQGQHMDIDTDATSLIMDCGNVGAIAISIDGKPAVAAGQLGPIGKVIHDYRLAVPTP